MVSRRAIVHLLYGNIYHIDVIWKHHLPTETVKLFLKSKKSKTSQMTNVFSKYKTESKELCTSI